MRSLIGVGLVLTALALHAGPASAEGSSCCACVPIDESSQPSIPALFCGVFTGRTQPEAEARCAAIDSGTNFSVQTNSTTFVCLVGASDNCSARLADADIACPASAGAPAVSATILSALVALLGGAGYLALRRRTRA